MTKKENKRLMQLCLRGTKQHKGKPYTKKEYYYTKIQRIALICIRILTKEYTHTKREKKKRYSFLNIDSAVW